MPLNERENWIYTQVLSGNVPDFLRNLVPVTVSANISGTNHMGTYYVTPDYVAIGTDADYFLEPMTPLLAQRICDAIGCTLPTRKMVNQVWTNTAVKMTPQTISPSAAMITVPVFADHNAMVRAQRNTFTNSFPLGSLVSGNKKDVIISTKIYTNFANAGITKPVVIYGWHYPTGSPIQPLYNGHEETYADYSHGVRLVQNSMTLDGNSVNITDILTNSFLAALLSDESVSEGTSAGVIKIPRYTTGPVSSMILIQPGSKRTFVGGTVSFQAKAGGDPAPGYRWLFNGGLIAGATSSTLIITNVQPSNAGTYSVQATNSAGSATSRTAWLRVTTNSQPVVFADDFDANTSSSWKLFWGADNGVLDHTADWAYDHRLDPFTFNSSSSLIPSSPNSLANTTRGVRFTVNNNDAAAATAGVNIYPKNQNFSGNYALKFDLWIQYPGGAGGINSTGSTEHAIFGLNHLGTQPNWGAPTAPSSDGLWFGVDGEGGTSRDYRAYLGNPAGTEFELIGLAASGLAESNNAAGVYPTLFPATRFETTGAPGKNWIEVELRQTNNFIYWILDGTIVAQRTNISGFTSGNIMLGFMDTFPSIANPAGDAFVIYDNVRVEELTNRVRFLSSSALSNQQLTLNWSAIPGRTHALEASTNLIDWQPLHTAVGSNAPLSFTDLEATNIERRFYRVRLGTP